MLRGRRGAIALLCFLSLALFGCELEDQLRIDADGSGTYRAKFLVEKEFGDALTKVREEAAKNGFRVAEEGETATRKFVVISKELKSLSELNDSSNRFELTVTDDGFLRKKYLLHAHVSSLSGFHRQLTIDLPGSPQSTSVGELSGGHVIWDCTHGGDIEVASAGFALAPTRNQEMALLAVVGLVLLMAVRSRRKRATLACRSCHAPLTEGVQFCANCGAAAAPAVQQALEEV
jgi:hypothetical protein